MRSRAAALGLVIAALGYGGAAMTGAGGSWAQLATSLRNVARPLALPFLWRGLAAADREEQPEALSERGRRLMRLLPEWTDGHVLFASELAFAASQRAADAETATDRLQAALTMLEEATSLAPAAAPELLAAAASFVEIRCRQTPEVAEALTLRTGRTPAELADEYLRRALANRSSASLRERRTYLQIGVVAAALRTGDEARARETITWMRRQLTKASDSELAGRWDGALERLESHLDGNPDITLKQLLDDPILSEAAAALAATRAGGRQK